MSVGHSSPSSSRGGGEARQCAPLLAQGELLVQPHALAARAQGDWAATALGLGPFGQELAGLVVDIGSHTPTDWLGARVMAMLDRPQTSGNVVVPATQTMRLPPHMSLVVAAALPAALCGAYSALEAARARPLERVLLQGQGHTNRVLSIMARRVGLDVEVRAPGEQAGGCARFDVAIISDSRDASAALACLSLGGRLLYVGSTDEGTLSVDTTVLQQRALSIRGVTPLNVRSTWLQIENDWLTAMSAETVDTLAADIRVCDSAEHLLDGSAGKPIAAQLETRLVARLVLD